MFGMVAVLVMLLGMIAGVGHLDGLTLGEPSEEPAASSEAETPARAETPAEAETHAEAETPTEAEPPAEAETPEEAETPAEQEPGPTMTTGEEQEYLKLVVGFVASLGNNVNQVGSLLAEPALEDQTWRAVATALLSGIEESPDAISEVVPPPALQEFHDAAVLVAEHCSEFAVLVYESLEEGETELSEEATAELMKADEAYVEMERLAMEYLEEHPVDQE